MKLVIALLTSLLLFPSPVSPAAETRKPNVKLFNLKDDIGETNDLIGKEPDKVRELQADWDKWSAEQAAPTWVPRDPAKPRPKGPSRKRASNGK